MKKSICILLITVVIFTSVPMVVGAVVPMSMMETQTVSIEDHFTDDTVVVIMSSKASTNLQTYSVDDFSSFDCVEVKNLTPRTQSRDEISADEVGCESNSAGNEQTNADGSDSYNPILSLKLSQPGKANVLRAIELLNQREDVIYAGPNYIYSLASSTANDQYYNDQWAINKIQLPMAWTIQSEASSILVGVVDSGIDGNHPDLVNRLNASLHVDCLSGTAVSVNPPTDPLGHGTHVAGIIGAQTNNLIGISGVCQNIRLVSLRVINENNRGTTEALVAAINHARVSNIPILNMSLSAPGNDVAVKNAIADYPGLVVCAAGNKNLDTDTNLVSPAGLDVENIISVGASTAGDRRWVTINSDKTIGDCSNYGATTVDLFAPGASILSCYTQSKCVNNSHDTENTTHFASGYHIMSGTSMAAPYVTGVAALMLAENPWLKPWQIKQMIMDSVDVVYDSGGNSVLGDLCVSGGRLNAYKALLACHVHDEYDDVCAEWHGHTCETCDSMGFEESHEFLYFAANPGAQIGATHRNYCHCGYYRVEYHTVRAPEAGALTFPAVCIFCCGTAMDGNITMSIPPEVSQMSAMGVAPGTYTLSDGTTVQILTENGSYVLPSGIIVLVDEDADLAEAGLLDPYALVENLPTPSNPGHVTE